MWGSEMTGLVAWHGLCDLVLRMVFRELRSVVGWFHGAGWDGRFAGFMVNRPWVFLRLPVRLFPY